MEKAQFTTVLEWVAHGNIMDYIKKNSVNRLELVSGFVLSPSPLLTCKNSCMGLPKA